MKKQELVAAWKQNLINENWDADLAQKEAERVYADFPDMDAMSGHPAAPAVEVKPKATRKRKEPTE